MNKLGALPILIFFCLSTLTAVNSYYLCSYGEARWRKNIPCEISKFRGVGLLPYPLETVPALRTCWKPIKDTPGCAFSIIVSSQDNSVTGIDQKCCGALLNLNHGCIKKLFSPPSEFTREFGEKAVGYCFYKRKKGNKADAPALQ